MNLFQIKICGVTRPNDAVDACQCGADAIGLNFYPPSPRFVTDSEARAIIDAIRQCDSQNQISPSDDDSPSVKIVGVFVNLGTQAMVEKAIQLQLDGIQLHGDEQPPVVAELRQQFQKRNQNFLLIRAIRTQPASKNQADDEAIALVETEIAAWSEVGVDAILLDAAVPGEFGGTGKTVDWYAVPRLPQKLPLILAGGLHPGNVEQAIDISQALAVDVASGVESSPGKKDRVKVSEFVSAARRALERQDRVGS